MSNHLRNMARLVGSVAGVAVLMASAAQADTILVQQSWEAPAFSNGSAPGSPFTVTAGAGDSVAVTNAIGSSFDSSSQSIAVVNGATTVSSPVLQGSFTTPANQPLKISYDLYLSTAGYVSNGSQIVFRLRQGATQGIFLRLAGASTNINLSSRGAGGVFETLMAPLTLDTWYRFEITANAADNANDTFTLKVTPFGGATQTFANKTFFTNLTAFDNATWTDNTASTAGSFNVDNVTIASVPEPASLSLIGIVSVFMLYRR
ncbi:MAG: PEP-CTERM sorting domain-containing protein [Phycisphaerales bacterium]